MSQYEKMTPTYQKINKDYQLSDSSVNVYGFRLLTEGYLAEEFRKNPIGYYMHQRQDGIALKWEDIRIEGDKILGSPVVNLSNARGAQTLQEAQDGFLNAASMGHIVIVEQSTDPALMLPNQTGPTITKWYNKECSLVDIPGNVNALVNLYDQQGQLLQGADLAAFQLPTYPNEWQLLDALLQLEGPHQAPRTLAAVQHMLDQHADTLQQLADAQSTIQTLQTEQLKWAQDQQKSRVEHMLNEALIDKKITVALQQQLAKDYAQNADGLTILLKAMPAYRSMATMLADTANQQQLQWSWDDYEQHDPTGQKLAQLKAEQPEHYKSLFQQKFQAAI